MNRIRVSNQEVTFHEEDDKLEVNFFKKKSEYDIPKLEIIVLEDTYLEIIYDFRDDKLEVEIHTKESVCFELFEIQNIHRLKVQYTYYLEKNSYINVQKFYLCKDIKERSIIYLNGENAKIDYTFKTIATALQRYDIYVYHNQINTKSNLYNYGITDKEGGIILNVTGNVYGGMKDCELNQNNQILAFNQKKSVIQPILLIDDKDVIANHSAYIGNVNQENLFYLMSRGISLKEATILLAKGFLLDGLKENKAVLKLIDEYWG